MRSFGLHAQWMATGGAEHRQTSFGGTILPRPPFLPRRNEGFEHVRDQRMASSV
jgi:hypothetical protein